MARLPSISKYCVVCREDALAFALSHVYAMLMPSMGICLMPLIVSGWEMPAAWRWVGTLSMRGGTGGGIPPNSLIARANKMTPLGGGPRKWEGTFFTLL